jgi:hypothetical protein
LVKRRLNQATTLQQLQSTREDIGRDILWGGEKLLKFGAAGQHISHNQQAPTIANQIQGASYRTLRSPRFELFFVIHRSFKISINNSLANTKSVDYHLYIESHLYIATLSNSAIVTTYEQPLFFAM